MAIQINASPLGDSPPEAHLKHARTDLNGTPQRMPLL